MFTIRRFVQIIAVGVLAVSGLSTPAYSQLPPHEPGTICVTPTFWCWARPPGRPGAVCFCPTPSGPVKGALR